MIFLVNPIVRGLGYFSCSTTSYFDTMAKVRLGSDILKPFSGEGDVMAWLKKVRQVARVQHVDDVASMLPLYQEGGCSGSLYGDEGGPEGHQRDRGPA